MPSSLEALDPITSFLRGDAARWQDLALDGERFLELCREHEAEGLCFERLSTLDSTDDWPPQVQEALSRAARSRAAEELLRAAEVRVVLDALTAAGIRPILVKGTPLAYTLYESPASRPRDDTDLLVAAHDVDAARHVLRSLEYAETIHCSDLFSQFEVQKRDRFGVIHAFDVHWRISAQPVFADVLTHGELLPRAAPVPALGPSAIAPCRVDALQLACVHPVMHHRNQERMLWVYDIHLLAAGLSPPDQSELERLARTKKMAQVCARGLRLAQTVFGTPVPAGLITRLTDASGTEPSAAYLASERKWHHETVASLNALPRFSARARLLRQVLLPSPGYMLGAYGLRGKPLGSWLLPALYVHRNLHGAWKILAGKK